MRWDPAVYARYGDERSRAFFELLARVPVAEPEYVPEYVVDLGCGPGPLTAALRERWPQARVVGVDSSTEMVDAAQEYAAPPLLTYTTGDVAQWEPDGAVDVVVANAVLQWLPDHLSLLARFASWLAPGGALAFQVPDNFGEPSHTLLRELRTSPRWSDRLGGGADRAAAVERPERYLEALTALGLAADVWQSTYLHVLPGDDAVLEWVRGTALRPVLSALDGDERAEFLADYGARLRAAYPRREWGTLFPFRRTYAVATRARPPR